MTVLSLFDGIACGRLALERAGIPVSRYLASEIEPNAIKVARANWPDIEHIGDVTRVNTNQLPPIDLLIGGNPCQGFSRSGKKKQFHDPRSKLFFEYARILNALKPRYFLLENVVMKKESEDVISSHLGVKPLLINSALVSAQNRKRLYWTNIPDIVQPVERGITWGDIREHDVPAGPIYYSEKGLAWIQRHERRTGKTLRIFQNSDKMQMLEATMHKKYSSQRFFGILDTHGLRYITPTECERCQTIPDGYMAHVSNTQRYTQLGNGWTVDVIAHILRGILEANTDEMAVKSV